MLRSTLGASQCRAALAKIDEDFRGAKDHWGRRLCEWKSIVNLYRDKLPSELVRKIEQIFEEGDGNLRGGGTGEAGRNTAALAIVTRFFVTCQIFEVPVERVTQ